MIDLSTVDKQLMKYFRELSPRDRRLMLDDMEDLDHETRTICTELYTRRYTDPKDPEHRVDNWLWKIVFLPGLYKKKGMLKKAVANESGSALADLRLEDAASMSDIEKTCLYLEFRNAARRYLSTCNSANYASKMMGLRKASPEEKKKRACEDIWMASRGLALASGMEEKFDLWCQALRDELMQYDSAAEKHYNELENNYRK